ncbi:hypothetical protein BDR07DRAFT_1615330 [Suillus spraguei]|nr:hypothetical protein BDR07DRAFT_1615330 [Suillus spraguei]
MSVSGGSQIGGPSPSSSIHHHRYLSSLSQQAHDACITADLSIAEESLTQDIHTDANDYTSYAHRSFILARKHAWNLALDDAIKSISIRPSLTGYISKGIALCGKGHVREARIAFDAASMFTNQDPEANHFLLLIKAIALFSADQHEEAMLLIKELAAACPNTDPLARHAVIHLRVQLGINALDGARYDEAADHFTIAVNSTAFSSKFIHLIYEELTVLFGWDFQSLCLTAHQKRCQAFLLAGECDKALEAHKHMMDGRHLRLSYSLALHSEFKEQYSALVEQNDSILSVDMPGQEQYGYDMEPDFFHGMYQHSRPQPQQRPGCFKRLRHAMITRSASPPAPAPALTPSPPTPPAATPTAITARLGNLFSWRSRHAGPRVINVPFARGLQRCAATGAPGSDDSLICDEEYHGPTPNPNLQPRQQEVTVQVDPGEHGGGRSC